MRRRERLRRNFQDACKFRSIPMQLVDLLVHKLKINTHWEDYYRFGFYRRDRSWAERALYLGERGSKYWPWEGNSRKFDSLFIRKSLQKAVAVANGLPTPRLLLRAGRYYPICSKDAFTRELGKITVPFILKIDGGMQGMAVHLFEPDAGMYRHKDDRVTADWIWDRFSGKLDPGFIIEEQVRNHPAIDEVHPASLNTLRLVTIRTADGNYHLLRPFIKFGRQGSHVDNLKAGGLLSVIDDDHQLGPAVDATGEEFDEHPDTGVRITGLAVPFCEDAFRLALDASRTFGFLATIGWDIGITPDGPTIIEGNTRWGCDVLQDFVVPYLTADVAAGLMPRSWWTPWDRTHIYPMHIFKADGGWWQKKLANRRRKWNV